MKYTKILMIIVTICLIFISCESTCDPGYTDVNVNGQDICMPDYVVGETQNFNLGNEFYHHKFGVITFNNGNWTNFDESTLTDYELNN